jgi:hypothetical protein
MFFHLIPLQELKRHSVTYWRPGRDSGASADTWVILAELESGFVATVLDLPAEDDVGGQVAAPGGQTARANVSADTMRSQQAEEVLTLFLHGRGEPLRPPATTNSPSPTAPQQSSPRSVHGYAI